RDAGFDVSVTDQEDENAAPGTVLEQDPAAGTKLVKGKTVKLTVAKEPAPVEVPDVSGQTQDEATKTLDAAGFKVRVEEGPADTPEQEGTVIEQDPAAGDEAKKGSRVTITIGKFEPAPPDATATPSPTATAVP